MQNSVHPRLKWKPSPKTVLVIQKLYDSNVLPAFIELVQWLIMVNVYQNIFNEDKT